MSVIVGATSLTSLAPYLIDFTRAASAASELFKLMDRTSLIDPFDDLGHKPTKVTGDIDFENVTFSYPTRPGVTVLNDFSLRIPAGKVTALVGASGSGKSTIIGLIERWYNPNSGTVRLDGGPIEKLNVRWLRQHVRLVQQEPVLFIGSVFDNISSGLVGTPWENDTREVKLERVKEAARIAFADDFIEALPQQYDTLIGERGGLLSGGQKQRVAIARSIVSQPRILLLDEATSALDPAAEEIVQKALDNVSQGRTTITIAHKLATIRNADTIVVMDKGHIVETGSHSELLAMGGAYSRLVKAQDLSVSKQVSDSDSDDTEEKTEGDPVELTTTVTRYSTTTKGRMESQVARDDYDNWKPVGLLSTIGRVIMSTPELKWAYMFLWIGCLGAGKESFTRKYTSVFNANRVPQPLRTPVRQS